MKISAAGFRLIEVFEGLRLDAYPDPGTGGEPWTIGVGTTVYPSGAPVRQGDTITAEQAREYLAHDVARFEQAVSRLVTVPLSQAQFDALVSLAYNIGEGALRGSTLLRRLNAGDYAGAAEQFGAWINAGGRPMEGLRRRRRAERALFDAPAPVEARTEPAADPLAGLPNLHTPAPSAPAPTASTPMAPLVPALLGVLSSVAPELIRLFGDKTKPVAERNVEAGLRVIEVARDVVAAASPQAPKPGPAAAVESIAADPALAQQFRAAVQERWYELTESPGGGIEGARKTALEVTAATDWRSLGYGITIALLAIMIVGGGGVMLWSLIHDPATTPEQRGMLIGALVALIGSPVAFFFGSSVSSRSKDSAIVRELGQR